MSTQTPGILAIWDAAKKAEQAGGITELEMRAVSRLGVATVNRIKNTLAVNGYLREAGQVASPKDGKTMSVKYVATGSREAVARAFCRRERPPRARAGAEPMLNGQGIGRVPSVFALASCMGYA